MNTCSTISLFGISGSLCSITETHFACRAMVWTLTVWRRSNKKSPRCCTKMCGLITRAIVSSTVNSLRTNVRIFISKSRNISFISGLLYFSLNLDFGVPEEQVPENLFLIFYPSSEGMEKKTLSNSDTSTGIPIISEY